MNLSAMYACWTDSAQPHPWEDISDVACGYNERKQDSKCVGCHRRDIGSAEEQLAALGALGRAKGSLNK